MIGSVVGLLTGDGWNVGAPAPLGYDLITCQPAIAINMQIVIRAPILQ